MIYLFSLHFTKITLALISVMKVHAPEESYNKNKWVIDPFLEEHVNGLCEKIFDNRWYLNQMSIIDCDIFNQIILENVA